MQRHGRGARKQLGVLFRVFLLRLVDLDLLAQEADVARLAGQFVAVFASVSFLFALPLLLLGGGRMPRESAWTVEHFFLELTMTTAGVLMVLYWDAAMPDRGDLLVLSPLPVGAGTMFLAKIAALLAAPGLAMLGLNVFSGLVWPGAFSRAGASGLGLLRVWPAYWMTMLAGGVFTVCAVLLLQGVASHLLPRRVFLRSSALLQVGTACLLLSVLFLEPQLESVEALTATGNQALLHWLPSYWFLGLFQQLNGGMEPAFAPLARRAWVGLAVGGFGAGGSLLLGYVRLLPKIAEQADLVPGRGGARWLSRPRGSLAHAMTLFSLRSLLRSRQHRIYLSFYLGVGLAAVLSTGGLSRAMGSGREGEASEAWLGMSLLLMLVSTLALCVLGPLPVSLPANWVFRVTQVRAVVAYRRAVRVAWIALGVGPGLVLVLLSVAAIAPRRQMFAHVLALLLLGGLLVEVGLRGFRKIPFACSYLPGKAKLPLVFWGGVVLLTSGLHALVVAEQWVLKGMGRVVAMLVVLVAAVLGVAWRTERQGEAGVELVFEETNEEELTALGLR